MKLLTKESEKKLPSIEEAKNSENSIVQVKYFHPLSSWIWYVVGYTDGLFWGL